MKADQAKDFDVRERQRRREPVFSRPGNVQRGEALPPLAEIRLSDLVRHIMLKFRKLYVAFKYKVYRLTANFLDGFTLPWFRIGLAALAVFIVLKKDVQFSINMRSPLTVADDDREGQRAERMGLAQAVSLYQEEGTPLRAAAVEELDEVQVKAYIRRFTRVAVAEMEKFDIPASIKMAQGIVESWAGGHPAAQQNNNHFGGVLAGHSYNSAWENWRAHSLLLKEEFPALFEQGRHYKRWARAFQRSGYTTDKKYADKLTDVIEKYQLYLLDE